VLHICGSPTNRYYHDLSLLYASKVIAADGFEGSFLVIDPDQKWYSGKSLDTLAAVHSIADVAEIATASDVGVNHLFCRRGVAAFRAFFEDILRLPLVGSSATVQTIATDKALTKARLAAAGVSVPKGEVVMRHQSVDSIAARVDTYPCIVKPVSEDNSLGLSLVDSAEGLEEALEAGWAYDDRLLIEEYIAGSEIRTCVIESENGELYVPAMIEYGVSLETPIRLSRHKLDTDPNTGRPISQTTSEEVPARCPADLSDSLHREIARQSQASHRALGCRDFSLWDFRVDRETGQPSVIEAGLFWAFGTISMISRMLAADGISLADEAARLWTRAAARKSDT
ncbi:MAG: D-alanine--D-alanine ligase, partial [Verrucomicrobiota bacterium]